jgi:hypothetical protein
VQTPAEHWGAVTGQSAFVTQPAQVPVPTLQIRPPVQAPWLLLEHCPQAPLG